MILATGQNETRRAFTLIEMIFVLALLVIITSIAVPHMAGFIRGRALDSEARRVMAAMHVAQSRAVSEGMPMVLWVDEKGGAYGFETETSGQNGDPKAEKLTMDATLGIAVVSAANATPITFKNLPAIRFQADGTIDEDSPPTLRLTDSDGFSRTFSENTARTGYDVYDSTSQR